MQSPYTLKLKAYMICLTSMAGIMMAFPLTQRAFPRAPAQDILTPQEKRGKQIYVQGTSSSGRDILAYLGDASLEVPGSAMTCANCHGLDGQGKPEGGVYPSNLSWEALSKSYGVTHPSGRKHPPYTERALELAITRGLDPGGNRLGSVMPRYQMSREDMADLIAYLKRVGRDRDSGVTDNSITIGTIVPAKGELASVGQVIRAVLSAYFDEINSQGGIYNRKIELNFVETADTPAATAANVRRLIQDEQVFAIASAFTAGADKEIFKLVDELQMPVIGPFTLYPQINHPLNRQVFYLLSGMEGQSRALVNFATQKLPAQKTGVLIVSPEDELSAGVIEAIKDQCQKSGCGPLQTHRYQRKSFDTPALAKLLSVTGKEIVYFLGSGDEAVALMKEADKLRWVPFFYLPGAAGSGIFDAPLSFNGRVFLSFPTSPTDQTAEGIRQIRDLATKHKLPMHHRATQLSVLSAAKILVEALKRAGKDISREKLIETLEGFNQYATGLTPAVTYGPNRRIGAMGAYVVTIDLEKKEFLPASSWINSN